MSRVKVTNRGLELGELTAIFACQSIDRRSVDRSAPTTL